MAKKDDKNNQINFNQAPNVPIIYTNFVTTNFSPFDFEMILGINSSNNEGIQPVANVKMSPQFMKEMVRILNENIDLYEKTYGKVD